MVRSLLPITDSNGEVYITNSSDGPLGFELITVDDFKIRAVVDGKSKGISSSITNKWILFLLPTKEE
jgi:hypothetical protein